MVVKKSDNLYDKWKDNSFNSCIDKKDLIWWFSILMKNESIWWWKMYDDDDEMMMLMMIMIKKFDESNMIKNESIFS